MQAKSQGFIRFFEKNLQYNFLFVFFFSGLIKQFLKDTFWGRLDFLIFGE